MTEKEKVLHEILTATQTGAIVSRIAKTLHIPTYEAFHRFFTSNVYAKFRTPGSLMSMLSDPAIVEESLAEQTGE